MQGTFFNCFISAIVGAISAAGTTWYLAEHAAPSENAPVNVVGANQNRFKELVVDSLVVNDSVLLVDPETQTATLEIKDGSLFAQKGLYAEKVGAMRVLAQKLQSTPEDPVDMTSPVFGELAINEDGGAYLALLSPRESHAVTLGFDKNEKGCVLSKNNDDNSMIAQAVFLKPSASDAPQSSADSVSATTPPVGGQSAPAATTTDSEAVAENPSAAPIK
ncbi:MAG: hypothetical protein J6X44_06795 [Thermoguttaceae bacterium]|nr:hypothetical protein [Thermoguttaceae bacterium]